MGYKAIYAYPWDLAELGFSERRLENGDILLDGAAAYANSSNHFSLAAERRSPPITQCLP